MLQFLSNSTIETILKIITFQPQKNDEQLLPYLYGNISSQGWDYNMVGCIALELQCGITVTGWVQHHGSQLADQWVFFPSCNAKSGPVFNIRMFGTSLPRPGLNSEVAYQIKKYFLGVKDHCQAPGEENPIVWLDSNTDPVRAGSQSVHWAASGWSWSSAQSRDNPHCRSWNLIPTR